MMGISLTYSLLKPHEVVQMKQSLEQQQSESEARAIAPVPVPLKELNTPPLALPAPVIELNEPCQETQSKAIVPYEPNFQNDNSSVPAEQDDFDLMELIAEVQNDPDDDLIMAATQVEEEINKENLIKKSTTALVKRPSPPHQIAPTFNNCKFSNIGTLNIHIHKN